MIYYALLYLDIISLCILPSTHVILIHLMVQETGNIGKNKDCKCCFAKNIYYLFKIYFNLLKFGIFFPLYNISADDALF